MPFPIPNATSVQSVLKNISWLRICIGSMHSFNLFVGVVIGRWGFCTHVSPLVGNLHINSASQIVRMSHVPQSCTLKLITLFACYLNRFFTCFQRFTKHLIIVFLKLPYCRCDSHFPLKLSSSLPMPSQCFLLPRAHR